MIMSTTIGLEELLRKKAHLKNNLQSLCEEERHLAHKFRILEEQKVVHELEDKIKAKQVVIGQLRIKKIELERKMAFESFGNGFRISSSEGTTAYLRRS